MEWSKQDALRFLKIYKEYPCVWDPDHESHKNRFRLDQAWTEMRNKMGGTFTIKELKKKKESLMAAYRKCSGIIKRAELRQKIYEPTWFAYSLIHSFMGSIYKYKGNSKITEDDQNEDENTYQGYKEEIHFVTDENEESVQEPECSSRASTCSSVNQETVTTTPFRKRQHNFPELRRENRKVEEDESYHFGKIVEKKLRKLPEDRRDLMMIKINQLLYDECHERDRLT